MAYIELKNVTYRYPLSKENALEDVNCKFEKGKFYGIIGENGGGKTTLCNVIRGLIPQFYKGKLDGEVEILGEELRDWDTAELGMENMGVPKEEMIDKVVEICKILKIEELMEKNPNELSGGQRQRVAFASIIAMDTEILVIDEPTSQLDPQGTQDIFEIISMLKKAGKTILLVEHKIDLIAEYCDEVIVMEKGKIAFSGAVKSVLANPELEKHGAMIPQAAKVGHELRKNHIELSGIPITIQDAVKTIKDRMGD